MQFMVKSAVFFAIFASTSALFNCTTGGSTGPCVAGGCQLTGQVCTVNGCCPETSVVQDLVCDEGSKTGPCIGGTCLGTDGDACIGLGTAAESCCKQGGIAPVVTTTTKRVTRSTCVDLLNPVTGTSDCPKRASLCTDANYLSVMRVQCPKTCGFCGSVTSSTLTCVDQINPATGTSDCSARRSLCTDAAYATLMKQQCCATCSNVGK